MDQNHKTSSETSSNRDVLAPDYGSEKEAWRLQEGYCSFEESRRLTKDAAQGLVLVEND
jgi:hypothetical protein